ncbi:MAG: type III-B CRISPR module-associated protein Cmr3 [Acidobacteriota bacterium]
MNATTFLLKPVDAWFFRDGRPYNKHEGNQMDVESLFPPAPTTLVGSIRAALARERGWNGFLRWSETLTAILGDGFEDLGQLSFSGPCLVRQREEQLEALFPAPLHLLGRQRHDPLHCHALWTPVALLVPGKKVLCDLGEVHLPAPDRADRAGLSDATGLWITNRGLNLLLEGMLPGNSEILSARQLWRQEFRVGLARDQATRIAGEEALYSTRYVRLCRDVSLGLIVRGIPSDWNLPDTIPLGGEGRLADCAEAPLLSLPEAPIERIRQTGRVTVTLLTPMCLPLEDDQKIAHPAPGQPLPGLPGARILSACVGRPLRLGGWDSLERRPVPLTPALPPGSTWFCNVERGAVDELLKRHGTNIGLRTAYGFGQIVLGTWNDKGAAL